MQKKGKCCPFFWENVLLHFDTFINVGVKTLRTSRHVSIFLGEVIAALFYHKSDQSNSVLHIRKNVAFSSVHVGARVGLCMLAYNQDIMFGFFCT